MLETILIIAFVVVFGIPVFTNTIGLFIVWKTQKLPAVVEFQTIDNEKFMLERNAKFQEYDKSFEDLDFNRVGSSILQDKHTDSHFRLYWRSDLKVAAMVATMKSKAEEITYIEIVQQYFDGNVLGVSNSPNPEAYPELDFKLSYRFPKIVDARALLHVHQKLKAAYKSQSVVKDYDVSRGFAGVEEFLRKESDALLSKGIVNEAIDSEGKRSLTLFGAFCLTFRSVPPGKNIWAYITERRARNALGSLYQDNGSEF